MKSVFASAVGLVLIAILGLGAVAALGLYDVAADVPHWSLTERLLQQARRRAIQARAADIAAPADLAEHRRVVAGAEHFAAHCAACRGSPGAAPGELGGGMYPRPADLTGATGHSPGELFWIVKHGIKLTGMPSWAAHGDEGLWDVVAFVQRLPGLSPDAYQALVSAGETQAAHHHAPQAEAQPAPSPQTAAPTPEATPVEPATAPASPAPSAVPADPPPAAKPAPHRHSHDHKHKH